MGQWAGGQGERDRRERCGSSAPHARRNWPNCKPTRAWDAKRLRMAPWKKDPTPQGQGRSQGAPSGHEIGYYGRPPQPFSVMFSPREAGAFNALSRGSPLPSGNEDLTCRSERCLFSLLCPPPRGGPLKPFFAHFRTSRSSVLRWTDYEATAAAVPPSSFGIGAAAVWDGQGTGGQAWQ